MGEGVKEKIVVALDVESLEKAKPIVEMLAPHVGCFKIGLELATAVGAPQAVEFVHSMGGQVFFDGKFNDIPNTVAAAARAASSLGIKFFSVHSSCGVEAMKRAVAEKGRSLVLAVTVLTSLGKDETEAIFGEVPANTVMNLAHSAKAAGVDGIICSPQELKLLNNEKEFGELLKVTPGIRPAWARAGDQKRSMTPAKAIEAGADYLVIGRPITAPPPEISSPLDAIKRITEEIASAL